MRLVLHIGDVKTGTSAIQQHFHSHKDIYREAGLHYIHDEGRVECRSLAAAIFSTGASLGPGLKDFGRLDQSGRMAHVHAKLAKKRGCYGSAGAALISSEHLFYDLDSVEYITTLKMLLSEVFSEFRVVVYLRHPLDSFRSHYSTHLKSGGTTSIASFLRQYLLRINHAQRLAYWAQLFGKQNIHVRVYAKEAFYGGDFESDFFKACGFETRPIKSFPIKNKTLRASAAFRLRLLNIITPKVLKYTPSFVHRRSALLDKWDEAGGPPIKVPAWLLSEIETGYRALNESLLPAWGNGNHLDLLFSAVQADVS